MANFAIKNLSMIRGASQWSGDLGVKIAEALESIALQASNAVEQTNSNGTGQPKPPPKLDSIDVTGQNGFLHVALKHDAKFYRGIRYYVEHADNPQFSNPHVVPLLDSRNVSIPVGAGARYVRAYAAYSSSAPNKPVYFGSPAQPTAVDPGGAGPLLLPSQGSGTGNPGVGLQGPGTRPYRPIAGAPPTR